MNIKQYYLDKLILKPTPKSVHRFEVGSHEPESSETEIIVDKRKSLSIQCESVWEKINRRVGTVFDKRKTDVAKPAVNRSERYTSDYLESVLGKRTKPIVPKKSAFPSESESKESETEKPEESDTETDEKSEKSEKSEKPEESEKEESDTDEKAEKTENPETPEESESESEKSEKSEKPEKTQKKLPLPKSSVQPDNIQITSKTTINGKPLLPRLPKPEKIIMRTSPYYMSNRKLYMQKLANLFKDYNKEITEDLANASCEKQGSEDFQLLIHQRIVRDYLNIYTPYRGLLLYHGLGSGKTCTSIALAEGMKSHRKIFVMTPASLKMNFFSELKKCGDLMYKKKQHWEFVSTVGEPQNVGILAKALSLPTEFIVKNKGAWLMDVSQPTSNFAELSADQQKALDAQLNAMIRSKYVDINYNGINENRYNKLTTNEAGEEINPFDGATVLIDEVHNFVSRISNKLKAPESIAYKLYDKLLRADNVRIVLMTGTPMINYPNELGVLYNILRGLIRTWRFNVRGGNHVKDEIIQMFKEADFHAYDYIDYTNGELTITRNPFGFINTDKSRVAPAAKGGTLSEAKSEAKSEIPSTTSVVVVSSESEKDVLPKKSKTKGKTQKLQLKFKPEIVSKGKYKRKSQKHRESEEPEESKNDGIVESVRYEKMSETKAAKAAMADDKIPDSDELAEINDKVEEQVQRELQEYANGMVDLHAGGMPFSQGSMLQNGLTQKDGYLVGGANTGLIGGANTGLFGGANTGLFGGDPVIDRAYQGIYYNEQGNISDAEFVLRVKQILRKNGIEITGKEKMEEYKALPEDADSFLKMFVQENSLEVKNVNVFKKRILGLTSYFRSAQESLLPRFIKTDKDESYHIVPVPMSDHQLKTYFRIRVDEMKSEKNHKLIETNASDLYKTASTYRIFSRSACNFVYPADIVRPMPNPKKTKKHMSEDELDNVADTNTADVYMDENAPIPIEDREYQERIRMSLAQLAADGEKSPYLSREGLKSLSPKFLKMLENLETPDNKGLHLVYSNFRSLEGIGIFKLVLEANGFAEFKLVKNGDTWEIAETAPENAAKPRFVLYTGTETNEEKEIIRNIYNSQWELVPASIVATLREKHENNYYGEIIKILMITASGAEGINLANTRFVHIMEPYWHMVRIDQVIGRARRICSHKNLPKEFQTVQVFLYISVFSDAQRINKEYKDIMNKDLGRLEKSRAITTDENLYEIALLKNNINGQLLKSIKETAIDCRLYKKGNSTENLVCYGEGVNIKTNDFGIFPSLEEDQLVREDINVREQKVKVMRITVPASKTGPAKSYMRIGEELFDVDTYENTGDLVRVAYYRNAKVVPL